MSIRKTERTDHYEFTTLAELRDWLNMFENTDLDAIPVETAGNGYISLVWEVETLSDGSTVINTIIK